MTDLNDWPGLVHAARIRHRPHEPRTLPGPGLKAIFVDYVVVPLNDYQLGNLLGALKRDAPNEDGDWYQELIAIVAAAMEAADLDVVESNAGDRFPIDDVRQGRLA